MATQYTVNDYVNLNPQYKKAFDPKTNTATITNTANNKSISFGLNQGQQYGLGSSENAAGSHTIMDLNKFTNSLAGDPTPQPQYKSPYQSSMDSVTNQVMNRGPFQYNPNTDNALKQAQGQATQNTMETMNERGILNSTVAGDRIAQEVATLIPQYEQLAYGRYNDETTQLMNKANFINSLDTKSYQQFQDQIQNKYQQDKLDYQKTQDQILNDRNKVNDAWSKVQNLGYVDNEASIILGVPVGTPSWDAKKAADDKKFELDKMAKDNEYKNQQIDKNFTNDVNLMNAKDKLDKENATIDFSNKKELAGIDAQNQMNQIGAQQQGALNLEGVRAASNKEIAQINANNSTANNINADDYMKSASTFINSYYTTTDEKTGKKVLTMQNKRDIANYIYNIANSGAPENVTDALFAQYDINYDFLKELGLAN